MSPADPRASALRAGLAGAWRWRRAMTCATQLLAYLDLLHKWNQAYNLSAVRDPQQMVHQHLLDCLAALPPLDRHLQGSDARILDVGSGAGLPGVVWALMRPSWTVVLRRRGRQEGELSCARWRPSWRCAICAPNMPGSSNCSCRRSTWWCRAPLPRWPTSLALTRQQLAPGGCWLAMKGKVPEDEMAALPADVTVFHVEPSAGAGAGRAALPGLDATELGCAPGEARKLG